MAAVISPDTVALIVAAGRGSRAAGLMAGPAKQYTDLGGLTVLAHSIIAFSRHPRIDAVMVAIAAQDEITYEAALAPLDGHLREKLLAPTIGGASRQQSVANGLEALARWTPRTVLIHDAARPFVSPSTISAVIDQLATSDGSLPVLKIVDTVKRLDGAKVVATEDRESLGAAQTPQGFRFDAILKAHRRARDEERADFTDDAAVAQWAGLSVVAVAGDPDNFKITTAADLETAAVRVAPAAEVLQTRVGSGFDVHAFGPGDRVRLCGVDIPHSQALKGHSDADVALHALTDALYGALGDGDIGFHFPPSDRKWRGADSAIFLAHARDQVTRRGGRIVHVDVTIICEHPKVGPHREAMTARLCSLLNLERHSVSIKATTTERLGFTGRGEGIAAQAIATVALPANGGDRESM